MMTRGLYVVLSGGERVPYPEPSSEAASRIGRANRRTDTQPEQRLRSELHRRGLRFRKDLLIGTPGLRVHADVAFTRQRLAVFVDGCFWHGCPEHGSSPKSNAAYWGPKLAANVDRDRRVDKALRAEGWAVLRIWEHEAIADAAALIEGALERIVR
jgi:DNA mismatch endonuclease (patch repair protein)